MSKKLVRPSTSTKSVRISQRSTAPSTYRSPTSLQTPRINPPLIRPFSATLLTHPKHQQINQKEKYKSQVKFLYQNNAFVSPAKCATKELTTAGRVNFWKRFSTSTDKQILYRSVFKTCYCDLDEDAFKQNMNIFHDYFTNLCKSKYPYNMVAKEYNKQQRREKWKIKGGSEENLIRKRIFARKSTIELKLPLKSVRLELA